MQAIYTQEKFYKFQFRVLTKNILYWLNNFTQQTSMAIKERKINLLVIKACLIKPKIHNQAKIMNNTDFTMKHKTNLKVGSRAVRSARENLSKYTFG